MAQYVAVAAAAVQAIGALNKGKQAEAQYKGQAQANEYDAAIMRQRAMQVRVAYGGREAQQRRGAALQAGTRRAAIAESKTGFGGSNADVEHQSEVLAEMDALNIRYQGELEAYGLTAQAQQSDYAAELNRMSATSAKNAGNIGAAGAILSGAGDYIQLSDPGRYGGRGGAPVGNYGPAPRLYGLYGSYQPAA